MAATAGATDVFHALYVYDDDAALLAAATPFIEAGLEQGHSVITVLSSEKWQLLSDALGEKRRFVAFTDCDGFYTRPEAALAAYDAEVRRQVGTGAPGVRLFAEFPPFATKQEMDAFAAYEAVVNSAFDDHPVSIVCSYDAREQPDSMLDWARKTHPQLLVDGQVQPNPGFADPDETVRALTPDPEPIPELARMPFDEGASVMRESLRRAMADASVSPSQASGMLLAATEVLDNARRHGGGVKNVGAGTVGGRFVCEISDAGSGLADAMAGYLPPGPYTEIGRGLWLARQFTERLELINSDTGLTVRLWA